MVYRPKVAKLPEKWGAGRPTLAASRAAKPFAGRQ
jgi:hypothetical protein